MSLDRNLRTILEDLPGLEQVLLDALAQQPRPGP